MTELKSNSIDWSQKCWRYFKVDRFIESIENGYLYFASASQFEDNFEGATMIANSNILNHTSERKNAIYNLVNDAFKGLQRLTKISCWHKSDYENFAMWKIYTIDNKGVAITTTPQKMNLAIKPYRIQPEYCEEDIIIGNVEYVDLTSNHIDDTMLGVFFYKHIIYSYENEIRIVISLRTAEDFGVSIPSEGIFVQVDYPKLIESVILGPELSIDEKQRIYQACKRLGLEEKVQDSCLAYKPLFI